MPGYATDFNDKLIVKITWQPLTEIGLVAQSVVAKSVNRGHYKYAGPIC